jgi:hypothetical protein
MQKLVGIAIDEAEPLSSADATVTPALLDRMRGEFRAMPGLHLTLRQATRLWGIDAVTCDVALRILVEDGFLYRTRRGTVQRTER